MRKLKSLDEFINSKNCLDINQMSKLSGGLMMYPRSSKSEYHTTLNNTDNSVRTARDDYNENGGYGTWEWGSWVYCGDCKP
jgi:hypothetical protein